MTDLNTDQREESLLAIKRLCRALIHDINNPLGAVSGYLQLTEMRLSKLQQGDQSVIPALVDFQAKTQQALNRISAMLQRLDLFSKIRLGPEQKIPLTAFWKDCIAQRSDEEQKRILLECPDPEPTIRLSRFCLEIIARELLDNALWATREHGEVRITVSSQEDNGSIVVDIADTGIGMSSEQLEKTCFPCYITREGGGFPKQGLLLGLGLPIVYQLSSHLGCTFSLNSQPGEGTQARLELPADCRL